MAVKKRGLGRGLNALLGGSSTVDAIIQPVNKDELREIDVDLIQRGPWQPRVHFDNDSLAELAESISAQGVVQPIVVRATLDNRFEIVAGERRWRATQLAGLGKIPAIIKQFDDKTAAAVSLIENIQRENLNPLEESNALLRLINEFEMTHQQVADTVARSRVTVSNLLRLQDLTADVKDLLSTRLIDMGHARALLGAASNDQNRLAKEVVKKGLSVRATESLVRKSINQPLHKTKTVRKDPDIMKLEDRLAETLGAQVSIKEKAKGKGLLEIKYNSLDELEGILSKIH